MNIRSATCLLALCATGSARADNDPPPPIRPTVTAETGDIGGKFFGAAPDPQKTHRYFIAAESEPWDFVPAGRDEVCGFTLPPALVAKRETTKLRYVQYTDATFTTRALANPALGILGPVLRGVVGEFLVVTFLNRTGQPLSMHPHGVHYDKDSEGAYYRPGVGRGGAVRPGARFTYEWQLGEKSGPRPDEPSSKGWLYHSHVLGDTETNLGLIGAIIVTDPKRARPDGTPADIDREFATLFMIFDESGRDATNPPADWAKAQEQLELGERYAINGRAFGNLRGLEMNEGERTRWYLFALGSEHDFHTAHWHGLRVVEEGRRRTDVVELLPASMKVADLVADTPGAWLFHCHVAEHMREGMFARLTVYPRDAVGVSRAPEAAFLGLPTGSHSLRIDRAEAVLNLVASPVRADIVIDGALGAPENFSVRDQIVRVRFGGKETVLRLDEQGIGKAPRTMLRINNADETAVAHGGRLDFELVFSGADWLEDAATKDAAPAPRPLAIDLGAAHHTALVTLVARVQTP